MAPLLALLTCLCGMAWIVSASPVGCEKNSQALFLRGGNAGAAGGGSENKEKEKEEDATKIIFDGQDIRPLLQEQVSKVDIKLLRKCLLEKGYCHIPYFIPHNLARHLAAEALNLRGSAFESTQQHTIYQEAIDLSYPLTHPRNLQVSSRKLIIDNAKIPPSSLLNSIYKSRELKNLVQQLVQPLLPSPRSPLYLSSDPYNSCYYNIYRGETRDGLGYHFDRSHFGVNLVLQSPEAGGAFEIDSSHTRDASSPESSLRYGFERVKKVLEGELPLQSVGGMEAGSLCVFAGVNSLHRVKEVTGGERVNAIFTFEKEEGARMNAYGRKKFFGRD